jgi:hypothetical protein
VKNQQPKSQKQRDPCNGDYRLVVAGQRSAQAAMKKRWQWAASQKKCVVCEKMVAELIWIVGGGLTLPNLNVILLLYHVTNLGIVEMTTIYREPHGLYGPIGWALTYT